MKTIMKLCVLFLSVCVFFLSGCFGKTKAVIPKDLPSLDASTARVIITPPGIIAHQLSVFNR